MKAKRAAGSLLLCTVAGVLACSSTPAANPAPIAGQNQGGLAGAPVVASGNGGMLASGGSAAVAGTPSVGDAGGAITPATGGESGSAPLGGAGGSAGGTPATADVDASTLVGKHLFGYQGWFACPGDGGSQRWVHWFKNNQPNVASATFDLWPDVSELGEDELFATSLTLPGGGPARLFSAYKAKTVARHFAWMKAAGIDGVLVQRFLVDVKDVATRKIRDQVLSNVQAGAEQNGRVFGVMYDISGSNEASLVADLEADWRHLTDDLKVTASSRYQKLAGKPLLALWGLGFGDRPGTAAMAKQLQADLRSGSAPVTLMGGVPAGWRTLSEDSKTDAAWTSVYRAFDVLSPWSVGRYVNDAGADKFKADHIVPDLAELAPLNIAYMPVLFPGFSWHNLNGDALNQIPRRGGAFYWRQVYDAVQAGSNMLYGAMFDEVDEGTAFFKVAPNRAALPVEGTFLAWDADGAKLPSDWYLQLAGAATRTLRGQAPLSATLPLTPP